MDAKNIAYDLLSTLAYVVADQTTDFRAEKIYSLLDQLKEALDREGRVAKETMKSVQDATDNKSLDDWNTYVLQELLKKQAEGSNSYKELQPNYLMPDYLMPGYPSIICKPMDLSAGLSPPLPPYVPSFSVGIETRSYGIEGRNEG